MYNVCTPTFIEATSLLGNTDLVVVLTLATTTLILHGSFGFH